jgi:hypothetical protein
MVRKTSKYFESARSNGHPEQILCFIQDASKDILINLRCASLSMTNFILCVT